MYTCIIIHEQPEVADRLAFLVGGHPELMLKRVCLNSSEAINVCQSNSSDLIFIGNEITGISGVDFVNRQKAKFGLQSFESVFICSPGILPAKSYLNEGAQCLSTPLLGCEFKHVLERIQHRGRVQAPEWNDLYFFFSEMDGKKVKFYFSEIDYVEAAGNYVTLITRSGKFTIYKSMLDMEAILPSDYFLRFHKSYITSVRCIYAVTRNELILLVNGRYLHLSIGLTYKEHVIQKLKLD